MSTESPPEPREVQDDPKERRGGARGRVVIPAFHPSAEAVAAYAKLAYRLKVAQERGEEVPCLGPGVEAWTSGRSADQQIAADRCLDCVALALCGRYADLAEEPLGVWGGEVRSPSARPAPAPAGRRLCACGCDGLTKGGRYLPGHDPLHLGQLVRLARAGAISAGGARRALEGSPKLQRKLAERLGNQP